MKNLADLKRKMILGQKIEMLSYNGQAPAEKIRGVREVVKVQTNGVYLAPFGESKRKSWFDFPKADGIEINGENRFIIKDRTKEGEVWCVREYLIHN